MEYQCRRDISYEPSAIPRRRYCRLPLFPSGLACRSSPRRDSPHTGTQASSQNHRLRRKGHRAYRIWMQVFPPSVPRRISDTQLCIPAGFDSPKMDFFSRLALISLALLRGRRFFYLRLIFFRVFRSFFIFLFCFVFYLLFILFSRDIIQEIDIDIYNRLI